MRTTGKTAGSGQEVFDRAFDQGAYGETIDYDQHRLCRFRKPI